MHCTSVSLFSWRPLTSAIVLTAGTALSALPSVALAQGQVRNWSIAAGSLSTQLNQVAAQGGLYLAGNGALTRNKQGAALVGTYSAEQVLQRILDGSGLVALSTGQGRYELQVREQSPGVVELDTSQVNARASGEPDADVGFVPQRSSAGSKTDTPLLEAPQSISVINRAQMETQNVQSVTQALRYVPGVKVETYGVDPKGYDWLYLRGFNGQGSSDYRDGLRQLSNNYSMFRSEPYALERIEVARGPSSSLFGLGDAGGIINRVSKKPGASIHEVELAAGSHDRVQGRFDLGDALNDEGSLAYRVVGVVRQSNTQFRYDDGHEVNDDRFYLAPSLTWSPSDDTRLTVLSEFLKDDSGGTVAVYTPRYGHAGDTLLGDHSFNHSSQRQHTLGYELSHRFNDQWQFRQNLRFGQVDFILNNLMPLGTVGSLLPAYAATPLGSSVVRQPRRFDEHLDALSLDNQVQYDMTLGETSHTLLGGLDYTRYESDVKRYQNAVSLNTALPLLFNPANPRYGLNVARPSTVQSNYDQTQQQFGTYLQDQIRFGEHWLLTLAGRHDSVRTRTDNHLSTQDSTAKDSAFTGRAGLTYLVGNGLAPYVSYAESFMPNAGTARDGSTFDASAARQWEGGVKYQPDEALLLTLAAFEITKTNVLTNEQVNGVATGYSLATGEVRSRGVEAEARARLGRGWDVLGSYTYTDAQITRSNNGDEGNSPANVPRHMASGWLNYQVEEGLLAGLSVGAGVRYTSSLFGDNRHLYKVEGYTLFDAGLSYPLTRQVTLSLNGQNLGNKHYIGTCDDSTSCYPGETRSVLGSVRYRW